MNTDTHEKRQHIRIPFDARAMLSGGACDDCACQLVDISLKGALLRLPPDCDPAIGQACRLTITLSDDTGIVLEGHVAHREDSSCGLACDHIDMESMSHLRRIIEQNTGDEALLHRELEALIRPVE